MVAVTSGYLVSAYLETCDHIGVRSALDVGEKVAEHTTPSVRARNIDRYPDTKSLDAPCGLFCPLLWRRTINFHGMLEFSHGGWPEDLDPRRSAAPNAMRTERLRWRLGHTCDNPRCPNYMAKFR